jgi:hypothetical protein
VRSVGERKTPILVRPGGLDPDRFYALTRYTRKGGLINASVKHDVTEDVWAIVNHEVSKVLTEVEEALASAEPVLRVGQVLASYRKVPDA